MGFGPSVERDRANGAAPRGVGNQSVNICILTFQRPEGLARLLSSFERLTFEHGESPEVEIVVIDNDPLQSALPTCESQRPRLRWPLRYVVEPRRGIAQARNTAVRSVMGRAEFLVFLDDDEVPDPAWMAELLQVQHAFGADVVVGPVFPRFTGPIPSYVSKGRFFDPPRHVTGTQVDEAFTGNVLVRTEVFARMPVLFDERLGLAGGEDVHFFRQVARAGYRMIWANDARVEEWVPASRVSTSWILRRAYRSGNTAALCDRALERSPTRRAALLGRAMVPAVRALLTLPLSALSGRHAIIRSIQRVCRGAGYLAGAGGVRYEEYRRIHGS
jgi:succinoglycan biosynthesis protein ExoM